MSFECCHKCTDKRHVGCHIDCPDYAAERAENARRWAVSETDRYYRLRYVNKQSAQAKAKKEGRGMKR